MVGAGFAAGAVASSSFVAALLLTLRAGPLERATVTLDLRAGPLERVTAALNFQAAVQEAEPATCPASCPAPSVAFCLGPLWDPIEERVTFLVSAARAQPGWIAAFCCCICCLALGVAIGRYTAPTPLRRPHGRRPAPVRAGRREQH